MRKVIVCNLMSLDGYVAGPGGNLMVLPLDESFSAYNVECLRSAETLLLGRNTFEGFVGYWPGVADDADQPENEREISRINNEIEKLVARTASPRRRPACGETRPGSCREPTPTSRSPS